MAIVIHDYTVTVADIPGGHRLTATRGSEVQTVDVMGKSGGGTGGSGADGFSPIIEITEISGGHRLTVTDAGGTESFDVLDGAPGKTAYQYAQDGGYTGTEAEFASKMAKEIPDPYTLPVATADTLGGVKVGEGLQMDGESLAIKKRETVLNLKSLTVTGSDTTKAILDTNVNLDEGYAVIFIKNAPANAITIQVAATITEYNTPTGTKYHTVQATMTFPGNQPSQAWVHYYRENGYWKIEGYSPNAAYSHVGQAFVGPASSSFNVTDTGVLQRITLNALSGAYLPNGAELTIHGVKADA